MGQRIKASVILVVPEPQGSNFFKNLLQRNGG